MASPRQEENEEGDPQYCAGAWLSALGCTWIQGFLVTAGLIASLGLRASVGCGRVARGGLWVEQVRVEGHGARGRRLGRCAARHGCDFGEELFVVVRPAVITATVLDDTGTN